MADATTDPTPAKPAATAPQPDATQGNPDAPVDWESKFTGQQKVNRDLEQKLNELRDQQKTQNEALAKAFGLAPDETSDVSRLTGQVTALQEQFAATQRQNVVLAAATEHGISDPEDLQLLADAKDEDAIKRLAARIAKSNEGGTSPTKPKPDLTQGRNAGPAPKTPGEEFATFLTGQLG